MVTWYFEGKAVAYLLYTWIQNGDWQIDGTLLFHWHSAQIIRWVNLCLTHWGRVTHICVSKLTIIGSDNSLSPGRRQAIIWTSAGICYWTLGNKFQWTLDINLHIFIQENAFENVVWETADILSRPQCVNVVYTTNNISQYGLGNLLYPHFEPAPRRQGIFAPTI